MSYRQRASDTVGFEAPAPHIVVVCPSCKTSFAVETAAVAALETPRFHCSRCDDIFIMRDAPADMLPLGGFSVQSITHGGAAPRGHHPRSRGPLPESLITSSDFSLGSPSSTPKAFIEPNFDAPVEAPSRSELSLLSRSIDEVQVEKATIDRAPASRQAPLQPPVAQQPIEPLPVEEFAPTSSFVVTPAMQPPTTISSRQFVLSDPPPTLPDHALNQGRTKTQPTPSLKAPEAKEVVAPNARPVPETESYRPAPQPRRSEQSASKGDDSRRFSTRTQSLLSMAAPVLGSLAVLLGLSYCAQLSPHSVDALMNYITPSTLKSSVQTTPPSALGVKNLRLSFERTRNREFIPVVTGTVLNESGRGFEQVELEAIGFNGRGEIIASSRAPLRSALGNEKIENLSLEKINGYQNTLSAKDSSIKAREGVSFTIALLNGRQMEDESGAAEFDPSQIKYFSARIFSIERPR